METIYSYQDFRTFIRDYFQECQKTNCRYSLRSFANKVGLNVSNIARIINGQRNISDDTAKRLISAIKLHEREAEYFSLLVQYNQSRNPADKRAFYDQLRKFRKAKLRNLEPEKNDYFFSWWNVALRELINIHPIKKKSSDIAKMLIPSPKPNEIRKSLNFLINLGLVKRNQDDALELSEQFLSTPDEWTSTAIHSFQISTAQLGLQALDRFPKNERDISTLTLSLSQDGLLRARNALKRLRDEMIEIANVDAQADRIYQLNLQLFPLSRSSTES